MRLFIVGPGRHGKDTVAEIIKGYLHLDFVSSSMFVAEKACLPWLRDRYGIKYDSLEEGYEDRFNHRSEWREAIEHYCGEDLERMSREIFEEHDIYVGIRRRKEFLASRYLADMSIWVDAGDRIQSKDESLDILPTDCDIIIDNSSSLSELTRKVGNLCWLLAPGNVAT
jgi:hypothetical protein